VYVYRSDAPVLAGLNIETVAPKRGREYVAI
jgi:hypothetical protein